MTQRHLSDHVLFTRCSRTKCTNIRGKHEVTKLFTKSTPMTLPYMFREEMRMEFLHIDSGNDIYLNDKTRAYFKAFLIGDKNEIFTVGESGVIRDIRGQETNKKKRIKFLTLIFKELKIEYFLY